MGTSEQRSPTLADTPPLSMRKRKASGWDVQAPGYGAYSAMQAKQAGVSSAVPTCRHCSPFSIGLFNRPGADRTQIPPILSVPGLPPSMPVQTFGMGIGSNPSLSRQSRRLYIVSITTDLDEQNLANFFNGEITGINTETRGPGNPVLAVQCN